MTIRARNFHPAAIFDGPVVYAFWILLICILIYPKGFVQPDIYFLHGDNPHKQGQPAGPAGLAILAFECVICAIVICLARVRISQALGLPGILIIGAFLSYLVIGFTVSSIIEYGFRVDIGEFFRNHIFFFPALLATAFGGRSILVRMEIDIFLKYVLLLMITGCVFIIILSTWPLPEFTLGDIGKRFKGFHQSPNDAGMIGCATFALALSFLSKSRERLLGCLGLTIGSLTVLGSLSKTGILTLIATLLFVLVFAGKRRRVTAILWVGLLAIFFVIAVDILEGILKLGRIEHFFVSFDAPSINTVTSGRKDLWSLGFQRALESPLYGHGLGTFWKMDFGEFGKLHGGVSQIGVHNSYIQVFGEAGILPLLLYLMHTFLLVRLWWTIPNSVARCMVIGWVITLVSFSLSKNYTFDSWILGFFCGLVCAIGAAAAETHGRSAPIARPQYPRSPARP